MSLPVTLPRRGKLHANVGDIIISQALCIGDYGRMNLVPPVTDPVTVRSWIGGEGAKRVWIFSVRFRLLSIHARFAKDYCHGDIWG
jgi:hypothetical protein